MWKRDASSTKRPIPLGPTGSRLLQVSLYKHNQKQLLCPICHKSCYFDNLQTILAVLQSLGSRETTCLCTTLDRLYN